MGRTGFKKLSNRTYGFGFLGFVVLFYVLYGGDFSEDLIAFGMAIWMAVSAGTAFEMHRQEMLKNSPRDRWRSRTKDETSSTDRSGGLASGTRR